MKLHSDVERPLALAAIGLESEFTLFVDGHATRPEDLCRAWQARTGREVRLTGFSTHYNISMEPHRRVSARALDALSRLLTYIPPPR